MIEEQYNDDETQELKKALFEICKTEFDKSSAIDRLIHEKGPLVVDVFGNNPFEVMHALSDFYDFDDYENPEDGEWMSFADWSEHFANETRDRLAQFIFSQLQERTTFESTYKSLKLENPDLVNLMNIKCARDIIDFAKDNDYKDNLLGVEQSLSDWKLFFENDEFDLYNSCKELTEQNKGLTKKIEEIKKIIEE